MPPKYFKNNDPLFLQSINHFQATLSLFPAFQIQGFTDFLSESFIKKKKHWVLDFWVAQKKKKTFENFTLSFGKL